MKNLLDSCRARGPQMTALLRELVEIESPRPTRPAWRPLAGSTGNCGLGLPAELLPVAGGGFVRAREGERPVMPGHLEVWDRGTLARRPVRIEGDLLFGPGSFDMKGGIVVLVFALKALRERGEFPPVSVFLSPLEEVGCEPYREVMEEQMRGSAAVLDFEPAWPGGAVKTQRKGSASFTARGVSAHAGADFARGANAILELSRRLLDVAALTDLGRGVTVNVGTIRGGTRPNVVPDLAEAEVDVRFRTLEDGESARAALASLRPSDPRIALEIAGGPFYPPLERRPGVVAAFRAAQEVAAGMGLPPLEEVATGGASEASFAAALGVPTLDGLGADGDGATPRTSVILVHARPRGAGGGADPPGWRVGDRSLLPDPRRCLSSRGRQPEGSLSQPHHDSKVTPRGACPERSRRARDDNGEGSAERRKARPDPS
jgi:glutamate carboxypeptidase